LNLRISPGLRELRDGLGFYLWDYWRLRRSYTVVINQKKMRKMVGGGKRVDKRERWEK